MKWKICELANNVCSFPMEAASTLEVLYETTCESQWKIMSKVDNGVPRKTWET